MAAHYLRRILLEFQEGETVFEFEMKDLVVEDGRFGLTEIHDTTFDRHTTILDMRAVKSSKLSQNGTDMFIIREVKGT